MKREEVLEMQGKVSKGNKLIGAIDKVNAQLKSLGDVQGVQLLYDKSARSGDWQTDINDNPDIVNGTIDMVKDKLTKELNKLEKELEEL